MQPGYYLITLKTTGINFISNTGYFRGGLRDISHPPGNYLLTLFAYPLTTTQNVLGPTDVQAVISVSSAQTVQAYTIYAPNVQTG